MPVPRRTLQLIAAVVFGMALAAPLPGLAQGRPDCATVLRKMHKEPGHSGPREADPLKIAKQLGTDPDWVERCAENYGRRVKRHEDPTKQKEKDVEGDNQLTDQREGEEYEELSREEKETLGDKYYTVIEDDEKERRKLRASKDEDTHEWDVLETHEWEPDTGHEWEPFLLDDDRPFEE